MKLKGVIECEHCSFFPLCAPISICDNNYEPVKDALSRNRKVARGEKVCRQNRSGRSIFTVCKGVFKGTITDHQGEERVVGFYLPGSAIGLELLESELSTVDVEALNSAVVCELSLARFNLLRSQFPTLQKALMQLLMQELKRYQDVVVTLLGSRSAEEGLASFFLYTSSRMAEAGYSADYYDLPITYADIASFLGLTRETVTRLMAKLKKQNIVAYRGRKLEIIDRQALAGLATAMTDAAEEKVVTL
jgi:CRP/FNR family transcriptional regulator|tara:strand:- start:2779 stop:3522 length:744 start_codon:yes stop_codon:yes gene_type:complete